MPTTREDVSDTEFLGWAKQLGQPSRSQLDACRKLQALYREQKGKAVSLYRIAKAKGLIASGWLAQAEAAQAAQPATARRTPSRKAKTKVPTGRARRSRPSDAPLFVLGGLLLGVTGVALGILLRPRAEAVATVAQVQTPSPAPSEAPAWHAHLDALDRGIGELESLRDDEPVALVAAPAVTPRPAASRAPVAPAPAPTPNPQPEPVEDASAEPEQEPEVLIAQGAGASTVLEASAERVLDAERLLFEVYRHYDAEDAAALAPLVGELEAQDAARYAAQARGLHAFLAEDFPGVIAALEPLEDLDGYRERDALARAAMFLGRYDLARASLDADDPDAARILQLLDGPFRQRYPLGAAATETMTPEGHYRVITDLGLPMETLDAFERKLEQNPEAEREALIARFRKKHEGLHEVAAVMDKAHRAYTKLFATEPKARITPTVFVFSEAADFHAFSSQLNVGSTESVLGYYVPRYRVLVFFDQAQGAKQSRIGDETLNVLLHETFHQWLHLYVEGAPHWFNEGLAEYFGIAKMTRKQLHYGLVPEGYPSRLHNIRWALTGQIQEPMPLSRLLRADRDTFMGPQAAINYATAWSFVHFMASSRDGRDLLRDYFHALQAGKDLEQAYAEVFGAVDMNALQARWKDYTLNLK